MINISFEINGKRITPDQVGDALEAAMLKGVAEKATEVVKSKLSPEEQSQISIEIVGTSLEDLSLHATGPQEILDKIKAGLS